MADIKKSLRGYQFSNYIVYVDESGTPDIKNVDEKYPVFVLTFVVVSKHAYRTFIVPGIQDLKFEFFGHDMINLRAYEIRQKEGHFTFLMDAETNDEFMSRISGFMRQANFILIASVFKKREIQSSRRDIYHMALQFCLERLNDFLLEKNQHNRLTHIIAEGRGRKEDSLLKEEFEKILKNKYDANQSHMRDYSQTPMEIKFAKKAANSTGLQMADLVGHPIGTSVAFPEIQSRAYETIRNKFLKRHRKQIGRKIFPK